MEFGIISIIHAVLAVLCLIELGITAWMVSVTNTVFTDSPASFGFMLFNSIWSLLVLAYLLVSSMFLPRIFHIFAVLGLLGVTVLFWFAGSIALAVRVGGNTTAEAGVAFGFIIWAGFTGLLVFEVLGFMRGRGHGANADVRSKPSGV